MLAIHAFKWETVAMNTAGEEEHLNPNFMMLETMAEVGLQGPSVCFFRVRASR